MASLFQYITAYNSACKVIEDKSLWGKTVCRIWLPNQNAVVLVPRSALRSLSLICASIKTESPFFFKGRLSDQVETSSPDAARQRIALQCAGKGSRPLTAFPRFFPDSRGGAVISDLLHPCFR